MPMQSLRLLVPGGIAGASLVALAACQNALEQIPVVCARPLIHAVQVEVRDAQGRPNATGATVVARSGTGYADTAKGYGDSLRVSAGEEAGTYDVQVTKPFHGSATVRGVRPRQDGCGVREPAVVRVTLPLESGAPPVRQVVAPPFGYGFGWGNLSAQLTAYVEAAPGVSQQVAWVSRDTTVARVTREGMLTSRCRTTPASTWVVASSVADPTRRDSVGVTVHADQDPVRCPKT